MSTPDDLLPPEPGDSRPANEGPGRLPKVLLALVCLLLLAELLRLTSRENTVSTTTEASPLQQNYDYYIASMDTTRFTAEGLPDYRLQADRVTHYPEGNLVVLNKPVFTWFTPESPPWTVTAEQGSLRPDPARGEDRLDLQTRVLLQHTGTNGQATEMKTSSLTMYPVSKELGTSAAVTVQTPSSHLDSVGMRALLPDRKIELLSNVRGIHDQNPASR